MYGHSHSTQRQAMEWGSSLRVTARSFSRTSSATQNASSTSVTMSSGYQSGPSGRRPTRCSTSSGTPSPVTAETGNTSERSSSAARTSCATTWSRVARSTLLTTTTASCGARSATHWSPVPIGAVASTTRHTTSTSLTASSAVSFSRLPISVRGLWMPGVSTNTICASGRVSTPRIWLRVVWGLSETIDTLRSRIRLRSVDLPTFGRPTSDTKPERNPSSLTWLPPPRRRLRRPLPAA